MSSRDPSQPRGPDNERRAPAGNDPVRFKDFRTVWSLVVVLGGAVLCLVLIFRTKSWPAAIVAALGVLGVLLWVPNRRQRDALSDAGIALATACVISGLFFVLTENEESTQRDISQKQQLALQLALGRNLSGIGLGNQRLSYFDLESKNLSDAQLYGADLRYSDLHRTDFDHAWLNRTDLRGADLHSARLIGASLAGADLQDATVAGGNMERATAGVYIGRHGKHWAANLSRADLINTDLRGACLAHANLKDAELGGADLKGADLDYANLRGASFAGINKVPAYLAGASLFGAKLDTGHSFGEPSEHRTERPDWLPRSPPPPNDARETRVEKVADGDTIKLAHLGWARLIGVHAPEPSYDTYGAPARYHVGVQAKTFVSQLAPPGEDVRIWPRHPIREDRPGDTGRYLVDVWLWNGNLLNEMVLAQGFGLHEPDRRAGTRYSTVLTRAQTLARQDGRGVWANCPTFQETDNPQDRWPAGR